MTVPLASFMALLTCGEIAIAQVSATKIARSGETSVSATFGTMRAVAIINTTIAPVSGIGAEDRFAQCTGGRKPCSLTGKVRVLLDGEEIAIPRSAYADLGDISTATWSKSEGRTRLIIAGGDASESYVAKLIFEGHRLAERRLYSGGDEAHPLVVSHYYEVQAPD